MSPIDRNCMFPGIYNTSLKHHFNESYKMYPAIRLHLCHIIFFVKKWISKTVGMKNSHVYKQVGIDNNIISVNSSSSDETENLEIHKTYSLTNCLFECAFSTARILMVSLNHSCTPWFFPSVDMDVRSVLWKRLWTKKGLHLFLIHV